MSDLSVEYPKIKKLVGDRHKAYVKKFGKALAIVEGELELSRTRILAKLKLLSRTFVESGVIDKAEEMTVSSRDGLYQYSIRLEKAGNPICLYLLNTGKDVILSDSVGLAMNLGNLETRVLLVTDTKRVCKKFSGVLDNSFDWIGMSASTLESIHETIYDNHEVLKKELLGYLKIEDPKE